MPQALIEALKKSFAKRKRGGKLKGVDEGRYVYGRLNKEGFMKGNKETAKGREFDRTHP